MTQTTQTVEPPLGSRRVRVLMVTLSFIALMVAVWQAPESPDSTTPIAIAPLTIDLNQAPPRELSLLPGVGPVLAKRIAQNRDRLGPFSSPNDVGRVYGVGDKTIALFSIHATVDRRAAAPIRVSRRE